MSSSYGEQWLGSEDSHVRRRSSLNTPDTSTRSPNRFGKSHSLRGERRVAQGKQKAEKPEKPEKLRIELQKRVKISSSNNSPLTTEKPEPTKKKTQSQQQTPRKGILNHLELDKKPDSEKFKDLHPAVLTLGLLFSEYKIVGSNARCVAVLETLSKVIRDHRPPSNASFVRHIQKHLDPHIAFLLNIRSFSLSIREIVRYVKKAVADLVAIHPPLSDEEARTQLTNTIAHFIRARITIADQLIIQYGLSKIENGDVILTFAKSSVVESLLLKAKQIGKEFSVIIVDSRPLLEGKNLLTKLTEAGIACKYALISSIYVLLKNVTKVFMGTHAILNNGSSYSRIGSAAVAMAATDKKIPVMVCAETYKFINRTQVDSLVMNEKGDPERLVRTKQYDTSPILADWKHTSNLNILNLMYDVTPAKYISLVITEIGMIPCTSAPVIWREYK
ncbi:uncharacterized protein EV154DRAFT_415741 [Mucor mucedo]|uniref:uncharacterized protein n=1 Tax=Mucor mucedo TaxID=29922 RepID=UPI00221EC00E|nr:uncharacterized protein EV154DRAFT_415741 [Mucor mucedo]KAI7894109.1 hypothetical protein EV154DRAFT_415741 [Mucor mucedo]